MSAPKKPLLTVKQACELLGICRDTLTSLYQRGKLRVIRLGRAVRFRPEDLESFIERRASKVR